MSWSALPIELTLRILSFFDPTGLVNIRRVNSFFKSLIDETTTVQYRIALFASGMEDGPPGDLTTSERLDLLRKYEASWKNLEWNEHNTTPSRPRGWLGVWESYGNVLAWRSGVEAIDFVQLPSRLRGIPMRQWTIRFNYEVREFGVDSSQDLLVMVEDVENAGRTSLIHLRSLSTGEKHPLAGNAAVLEYTLTHLLHESFSVHISGEYIGILFMVEGEHGYEWTRKVVVWGWRTGIRRSVISADLRSFVFLGNNFILGSTSTPPQPALLVYSQQQRPGDSTKLLLRFLFGGPDIAENVLVSDSSTRWSPSAGLQVPFQITGDVQIITMNLQFPHDHGVCETSLILTKALLRYIESLPVKEGDGHDVDWGLHSSLFSERIPGRRRWYEKISFTFGMRYTLPTAVHLCGKPMIIICDICPRRCLRASKEERQESELLYQTSMGVSHRPRSILKSVPFPENIRFPESAKVMISDDGIVVFEETERGRGHTIHLLTI